MVRFKVVRLCKQEAMSIVPTEVLRYDLDKASALLAEKGYTTTMQGPMLIAKSDLEFTLYTSGRMLITKVESKEQANQAAVAIYAMLEGAIEVSSSTR